MLETVEVKNYVETEFKTETKDNSLNNGYDQFCTNNKFSDVSSNILIKDLDEDTKEHVLERISKGCEVWYSTSDNLEDIKRENGIAIIESGDNILMVNPPRKALFQGKIDTLTNLVKSTEKFLISMFKYNQKLKDFTKILERGKFDILEQYSAADVREYISSKFNNYTEKGTKYIGHMNTKSKLDYFPTNFQFQYASFQHLFKMGLKSYIKKSTKDWLKKHFGSIATDDTLDDASGNKIAHQKLYRGLVNIGRFDIIDEIFSGNANVTKKIVIADLFAGEGEWLHLFKRMVNNRIIHTIANEIEENRFEKIKEKKFNTIVNKAYEELCEIPEESINICLFNPPYGEVAGERNVKRFFNMMIEDNYLIHGNSNVVFALREDDTLAILNDIIKHFDIDFSTVFRHEGNEYDKLKQVCFVGRYRYQPYDMSARIYRSEAEMQKKKFEVVMKRTYEELAVENNRSYIRPNETYGCDIALKFDDLKVKTNPEMYISDVEGDLWGKVERDLSIETFAGKRVKLPNEPETFGAIANLISSGLINGEIDGEHPHCLAAGIRECQTDTIDDEGNVVTTKKSLPFCSILSGGQIIEIASGREDSDVIIEPDGSVIEL